MPFDCRAHVACHVEPHDARAPIGDRHDLHVEALSDVHAPSRAQLATRAHHRLPRSVRERAQQKNLGRRARVARAEQSRAQHLRRVEHERVARRDDVRKVGEGAMRDLAGDSIDGEKAAGVALRERKLRDLRGGELEIVIRRSRAAHVGGGLCHSTIVSGRSRET